MIPLSSNGREPTSLKRKTTIKTRKYDKYRYLMADLALTPIHETVTKRLIVAWFQYHDGFQLVVGNPDSAWENIVITLSSYV